MLVVTAGGGHLATEDGSSLMIGRGSTVVIPHSAGPAVLSGSIEGVRCLLACPRTGRAGPAHRGAPASARAIGRCPGRRAAGRVPGYTVYVIMRRDDGLRFEVVSRGGGTCAA